MPGAGESTTNHLDISGATNKPRALSRSCTAAELTTTSKISPSTVVDQQMTSTSDDVLAGIAALDTPLVTNVTLDSGTGQM